MIKQKLIVMFALIALLVVSENVKAEFATLTLTSVGGNTSACALLQFPPGMFNSGGYLAVDLTTPGGKTLYASAMMAFAAGKRVLVNRVKQAAGCYNLTDFAQDLRVLNN